MPPVSPTCRLADNLLSGTLKDRLTEWRAEGRSWDAIARELWVLTDREINITHVTAASWGRQLGVPEPKRVGGDAA